MAWSASKLAKKADSSTLLRLAGAHSSRSARGGAPEGLGSGGQGAAALDLRRAIGLPHDQQEVAVVGDEHDAVLLPVLGHLPPVGGVGDLVVHALDLDDGQRPAAARLEQAEVG